MALATATFHKTLHSPFLALRGMAAWSGRQKVMWAAATLISAVLLIGGYSGKVEFGLTEALGFVTGAWCVWLCVRENIWNWPLGIANAGFLLVVFAGAGLFADSTLQIVYIVLNALGWYFWLKGGKNRTPLTIHTTGWRQWVVLATILAAGTFAMMQVLIGVHDSAPFLDALTTTASLIAQYMLTRKLIENWWIWLSADVVYVGLYTSRHLYLTAVLYVIFFAMCVVGLRQWKARLDAAKEGADV